MSWSGNTSKVWGKHAEWHATILDQDVTSWFINGVGKKQLGGGGSG